MKDVRKVEHREEYRTISFLMKLPLSLRENKTKEYLCRSSERRERKSSDTVVIFSSISPVSAIFPFRLITEQRDIVSLRCRCGI